MDKHATRCLRPATAEDRAKIDLALSWLRAARDLLKEAGAPAAANAVRRAMKSTEGAVRHAYRREEASAPGEAIGPSKQ